MFHKSTKPLLIWFHAIWWMIAQKNGVSAKGLQKVLGLGSYQTAWTWLHKFRRLMALSGRSKLEGVVEVDEVLVGGKTPGKCVFLRFRTLSPVLTGHLVLLKADTVS